MIARLAVALPRLYIPIARMFALALCFLLFAPSLTFASTRVLLADSQPRILLNKRVAHEVDIASYVEVLHDAGGQATLLDVMNDDEGFSQRARGGLHTDTGDNVYWLRGQLTRSLTDPSGSDEWMLVLEHPLVQEAQLFVPASGWQSALLGLGATDGQRYVQGRFPAFPLHIPANGNLSFYLRVKMNGFAAIPVKVWNGDAYFTDQRKALPLWGLLFGGLMSLVLYNLFIYLSLREVAYLHLSALLLVMVLVTASREGFVSLFLTGSWPLLNLRFHDSAQLIGLAAAITFARSFLATARRFPLIDRILLVCLSVAFLLGVLNLFVSLGALVMQSAFLGIVVVFAITGITASMHASDRATRFFIAGWSLLFMSYIIFELSQFGLLPVNDFTVNAKAVALCVLGVALSLGLAAQIQRERFEKKHALLRQQEAVLELKYSEDQLQKKVLRDTLQAFPGMETLKDALQHAIERAPETRQPVVLVLVELHHVDKVEQQLGHAVRDELVTRATKRLSVILRGVSGVMPIGEVANRYIPMAVLDDGSYGFVLRGMPDASINNAIEEVEKAMTRPFFHQGVALQPGVSFGLARLGEQGEDTESLWLHAQISLQADLNKNRQKPSEMSKVDHYNSRNIALINELRSAIHEDQITLYFQPVYDLKRHHVCSVEVFSRWESFVGEKVSPSEIFYLAEVGGFVGDLTLRVIEKALRCFVVAVDGQSDVLKLSINLSPKCLRDDSFMDEVGLLLARFRLPAQRLSLEIKESSIIEDPSITSEVLNRIRNMGIGLTIDDFGNTYSNPSYLSSIPVTEVKLDQRLVAQLEDDEVCAMIRSLSSLCAEQNIKLVVHGVEDESTLQRLEEMGCSFAQGHHLAEPVLAREFRLPRNRFAPVQFQRV